MNFFYIVHDSMLLGSGLAPEKALLNAQQFGVDPDLTLDDLVDNTNGRRHQVTNRDVVLRDNLNDVCIA